VGADVLRRVPRHLEAIGKQDRLALVLYTLGGDTNTPWPFVPTRSFMTRFGTLSPVDPSVTNEFNPHHPASPDDRIPIAVEDVLAAASDTRGHERALGNDRLAARLAAGGRDQGSRWRTHQPGFRAASARTRPAARAQPPSRPAPARVKIAGGSRPAALARSDRARGDRRPGTDRLACAAHADAGHVSRRRHAPALIDDAADELSPAAPAESRVTVQIHPLSLQGGPDEPT
jgi:hypothetical protein